MFTTDSRRRSTLTSILILALTGFASIQLTAQSLNGREIMQKVDDNQRLVSDSAFNRMQLSTCRFGIKDNRITCAEKPRVKSLE